MARKKRPPEPITRTCSHCNGDGTEEVLCEDCGEALTTDNEDGGVDELCRTCAAQRIQDKADDAAMTAAVSRKAGEP